MSYSYQRIVVKIGSNVLTLSNGLPDLERIAHLVDQIAALKKRGLEVILISSGAVASGRSMITIPEKKDNVAARQLLASIGQIKLINTYLSYFEKHGILCSQVLVTKEDFRDRLHYLNIKNCLEILLKHRVVPVINENDVVSVTELMFTDNDELAGLVASMLEADALIILSNVDGIYTGDPNLPGSVVITDVRKGNEEIQSGISISKSSSGRGGMVTKLGMANKVASLGIPVHIANGKKDHILSLILDKKIEHTYFHPEKQVSGKKKWIAHAWESATGGITINQGAKEVLLSGQARSLLPVGITEVCSDFKKGDIIRIMDTSFKVIGVGIAEYGADKARERTGIKGHKALVHYNYFYLVD